MTDRSTILREMGLTPIWSLRGAVQPAVAEQATPIDPNRDAGIAEMSWEALVTSIAHCTACKLATTRNRPVPGGGDRAPSWMVIGSAPDQNEDKLGEPFVGKAGQLLDAMLTAAGKKRTQGAFITHLIKCHPPGNRPPEADEIAACAPYLKRQIALASPKLVLAAGESAGQTLLNRDGTIALLRATTGAFAGIPVVVTYHPAHLLGVPLDKGATWDDMLKARAIAQ